MKGVKVKFEEKLHAFNGIGDLNDFFNQSN